MYKNLIMFFIVIIFLIFVIVINNKSNKDVNISNSIIHEGIIPGYTEEEIKDILRKKADEASFSFEINSRPTFKNGSSEGNLKISNPPYNKYAIKVDIKLDSSGEIIFNSGQINPNHYIEYAKLNKNLKSGKYNATAIISVYDVNGGEFKGVSAVKLIINID